MSPQQPDPLIDAQLRDVEPPAGFFDRLRAVAAQEAQQECDSVVDQQLKAVELPAGFSERLRGTIDDIRLDEAIRSVAASPNCAVQLRNIPYKPRKSTARSLALAICLVLAVGIAYGAAIGGVLVSLRPAAPQPGPLLVIDEGPVQIAARRDLAPQVETLPDRQPAPADSLAWVSLNDEPSLHFVDRPQPGAFGELWQHINDGMRPWDDALRLRWNILGAAHHDEELPPRLERAAAPAAQGIEPPLAPGYDRSFLHVRGAHPVLWPAAHETLHNHPAPLSIDTASFDRTLRLAAEGRLPDADQVRVEDFLAALGGRFPPTTERLGIRTAAGPSPFGQRLAAPHEGLRPQLLQVGVKAGPLSRSEEAAHLTIALDISASMQWGGGLETTQRALGQLVNYLGPDDRLSLVAFNETTETSFEAAGRESAAQMQSVFNRLRADGGTNLPAGLRQALSAALSGKSEAPARHSLALITDSRDAMSSAELQQLEEMMAHAQAADLHVVVIDLCDGPAGSADWHSTVVQSGHQLRRAGAESDVLWTLVETLLGTSAVVAGDVSLEIRFNPESVVAYRLIGHEANAVAALSPASATIDLRWGQEASTLFEVWLSPNDEDDVAVAAAAYVDPQTGAQHRAEQRISRLQFAASTDSSPLSLQAAALAAATGEILHESPFAPSGRQALDEVRAAAQRVHPQLEDRPEFRRFAALLERLRQLHGAGN